MTIENLRIRQFRNITAADLEFGPGVNVFVGPNGQGKTNVLEAIRYASTATSHRTWQDSELVQWNQDGAHLRMAFSEGGEPRVIECGMERRKRLFKIDGAPIARMSDLYGHARTILFTPEDLQIVSGEPRGRRRFMDMAISQIEPTHIDDLQKVRHLLRQRNALLKHIDGDTSKGDALDPWDVQYAEAAAKVVATRYRLIREFSALMGETHHALSGEKEKVRLVYEADFLFDDDDEERTVEERNRRRAEEVLVASRDSDIARGYTTKGPHRDDVAIKLDDRNLRLYGSQGQRRTAILAARLGEAELVRRHVEEEPALLIDDVIYEMDHERRTRFLEAVRHEGQSFATCTEVEHLAPLVADGDARVFAVEAGKVEAKKQVL